MAISGHASFIPTSQEFLKHWLDANALLPALQPVKLDGDLLRGDLSDLVDLLVDKVETLQAFITDLTFARAELAIAKEEALARINAFNDRVRADLGRTAYARSLPLVPSLTDGEENFSRPLQSAARLWGKINTTPPAGFTGPLVLQDGTTEVDFSTSLGALKTLYLAQRDLETDLRLARENRNDTEDEIYNILKLYRLALPTRFAEGAAIVDSLPILNAESGRTPEAPVAAAEWDTAAAKGKISFTPIDDPDVKNYQLRWSPGEEFSSEDESVLDTLLPGAGTSFLTLQGLENPGDISFFRIVVELTNGHENGSEAVSVTRP